ncbi:MAG: hypothetical protein JJU15_02790 [Pararhodobacter sp.]|nr:hypothetical protein [Pararhodobacter sp.]
MTQPCLEIVTYKVSAGDEADHQREQAAQRAARLAGFSGWLALSGGTNREARADMVVWRSRDAAEAAAKVVGDGDDFADFRATITEFGGMGHFALPAGALAFMQAGDGMELGRFRLRPGVTDAAIRAAHTRMVTQHLSQQPGWRGQRLVHLQDGTWLDLAFAASEAEAQAICASWTGNPECDAFLELIEPLSMEFGTVA